MKKSLCLISFIFIFAILSGCVFMPVDEPLPPALTVYMREEFPYVVETVMRGDIKHEIIATAVYTPSRRVSHYFPVDGVPVLAIHVVVGQEVSEGDIIAELDLIELEDEHEELSRKRELAELDLKQLEEKQRIIARQAANAGIKPDNSAYRWSRDTLRLTIAHLDMLLENIEEQKIERVLYASTDGIVTSASIFHEGMMSGTISSVATITNDLITIFAVPGDAAAYMNPGDRLEMTLGNEVFLMVVIDPADHGIDMLVETQNAFLTFTGTPPDPGFEPAGEIYVLLDEVKNALYIPISFLQKIDERNFVYVMDNGLRTLRNVEPGLIGGGYIEIINGLSEGEQVVR